MKQKKKTRKIVITILFLLFNVAVVFFIARSLFTENNTVGFGDIVSLWFSNWYYLVISLALPIVALFAEGMKFFIMIGKKLKKGRKFSVAIKTAIFGKYYDFVTPLGSGGQPFQIMYLYKYGVSGPDSSLLPMISFVMTQFAYVGIAAVVFITGGHLIAAPLRISAYVGSFFMVFIPLMVILFSAFPILSRRIATGVLRLLHRMHIVHSVEEQLQKIDYFLNRYKTSFKQLRTSKVTLILTFLLSLLYQVSIYSIPFFVTKAIGVDVSYIEMFAMTVFVYSAIAYLPTPGNSGGAEISFTLIFTILSGAHLFWSMLLWRFSSYFLFIFIGLVTVLVDSIHRHINPFTISEKERHEVIYPLMVIEQKDKNKDLI